MSGKTHSYVTLARILRPRGKRGEVAAEILTDFPERLLELAEVFLAGHAAGKAGQENIAGKAAQENTAGEAGRENTPRPVRIASCWLSKSRGGQAIFHFEGCDSIGAAEKLRGLEVQVPFEQRVVLPAGRYYVSDLVGCSVFELPSSPSAVSSSPRSSASAPAFLGVVRDVQFTSEGANGTPVLAVDTLDGELLIPLAEDICRRVDTAARRIEVALPEGLRDLNRA